MPVIDLNKMTVYLCTVFPTDPSQLFHTADGVPYRSTSAVWDTYGEAEEWGERLASTVGKDQNGEPLALYSVQETQINQYRKEGSYGLN